MSEWLDSIKTILDDSLGSEEQRAVAFQAGMDLEAALPTGTPRLGKWAGYVRRIFEAWVRDMRYLIPPLPPGKPLPETMLRSDAEVAQEYQLRTAKGIEIKQAQLAKAREDRIERALDHLASGWDLEDTKCFICSKEEFRVVQRRAGGEQL